MERVQTIRTAPVMILSRGRSGRSVVEQSEEAQAAGAAADDAAGSRKRRARSTSGAAAAADGNGVSDAPTAEQLRGAVQSTSQARQSFHLWQDVFSDVELLLWKLIVALVLTTNSR